jgi:hypothetical protein
MRGTPLQEWIGALFDMLADARDQLDDVAYSWFIAIGTERIGLEAARLAVGEALCATRGSEDMQEAA